MLRQTSLLLLVTFALSSCVYPGLSLNKGRLLDPTMDPAKTSIMADSLHSLPNRSFERSAVSAGGSGGGACPTCR
jgi:hypothetical protein